MGLAHSPRTVTDGLVFAMDGGNPDKSWKGKPTTNLTPNLGLVQIQGAPTLSYVGVEDGWKKYSLNGTWAAGTYPYSIGIDGVAFTGGVTYSSGVYIRTNVPFKFATLFTGMNYVNEPKNIGGTSFSILQPDGSLFVGRTGFQYTSTTTQIGYILSQPVVGQSFSSATDFVYIKDGQVETGSFTTPFTSGTRSNTQAFIDLTGNKTITVQSLTYNSDGTFEFDGSTDNFIVPTIDFSAAQTVEIWMKPTESDANRRNPYNQAYGGFGTWTHEPDGSINAYFGTAGGNAQPYTSRNSGANGKVLENETACMCFTRDISTTAWYKNGIQVVTSSNPYGTLPATSANITIGDGYATAFKGSIFAVKLYDRALSAEEVAQNFNALRGRYGI